MTPTNGDWPSQIIRPLPRTVTPVADETLDSYICRLAMANRLDGRALRIHLTGHTSKSANVPVDTLAVVSGQPAHSLRYAILELGSPDDIPAIRLAGRPPPGTGGRAACAHCALVQGHRGDAAWCWNHHDNVICHRHRRWVGDGNDHQPHRQPDLTAQPDIMRANLRHRRMIRHLGRDTSTTAYREATNICGRWHQYGDHDDEYQRLMLSFHGPHWQVSKSDPTIYAARYPQTVTLTALLASPYWRAAAQRQWPEPTEFINQVRRTIAPRYRWSLRRQYGHRDPLTELIVQQRHSDINDRDRWHGSGPAPNMDASPQLTVE